MNTKWCHQCGGEFVARVEVCPDCGLELSFDPPGSSAEGRPADDHDGLRPGDNVVYELHEWPEEARRQTQQLLTSAGIPHVWQGTDLLVRFDAQDTADALIDQVELTMLLALDPEADKVAYDLDDLDDGQLDQVLGGLAAEGIPHELDEETGELLVHDTDEERVEALLDAVDFPDALPVDEAEADGDDGDPLAAQEAMSALFVAADRLQKNARDHEGVLSLVAAADDAAGLPVPYGFADAEWQAVVDRSGALRQLIEDDDSADEAIEEEAGALRTLLRQYV